MNSTLSSKDLYLVARLSNKAYRDREYLTHDEVNQLIEAAYCRGRNGKRDSLLILMLFRHGLRAIEASNLKWSDVYFDRAEIWIERAYISLETASKFGFV